MKRFATLGITLTLAALLILVLGLGAAASAANEANLNKNSGTIGSGQCVACHGNKAAAKSLDASVLAAHKIHYRGPSKVMHIGKCNTCHATIDTLNDSGASLRKQVSATKCLSCHGTFVATVTGNAHNGVVATSTNCLDAACHNSRAEVRKAHRAAHAPVSAKSARIAYCSDCHGGNLSVPALYAAEETNPATW